MKKGIRKFILAVLIGDIGAGLLMSPIKAASSAMKSAAMRYISNRSAIHYVYGIIETADRECCPC